MTTSARLLMPFSGPYYHQSRRRRLLFFFFLSDMILYIESMWLQMTKL